MHDLWTTINSILYVNGWSWFCCRRLSSVANSICRDLHWNYSYAMNAASFKISLFKMWCDAYKLQRVEIEWIEIHAIASRVALLYCITIRQQRSIQWMSPFNFYTLVILWGGENNFSNVLYVVESFPCARYKEANNVAKALFKTIDDDKHTYSYNRKYYYLRVV